MLLLLLGDMSLNSGPLTLGFLNARFVRSKGPLLVDMFASNDFFCLMETHIHTFDLHSFLWFITSPDFIFLTGLVPQVLMVLVFP